MSRKWEIRKMYDVMAVLVTPMSIKLASLKSFKCVVNVYSCHFYLGLTVKYQPFKCWVL